MKPQSRGRKSFDAMPIIWSRSARRYCLAVVTYGESDRTLSPSSLPALGTNKLSHPSRYRSARAGNASRSQTSGCCSAGRRCSTQAFHGAGSTLQGQGGWLHANTPVKDSIFRRGSTCFHRVSNLPPPLPSTRLALSRDETNFLVTLLSPCDSLCNPSCSGALP